MRLEKLRQFLTEQQLDVILISQPENRRYLSGFTGSAGVLLISANRAILAADFRYYSQVANEAPAFELAKVGYEFLKHLPDLLKSLGARRVGFESAAVSVAEFEDWKKAASDVEWVPTRDLVEGLRAVKEPEELNTIRHAVALTDTAFTAVAPTIRPGMTEREVAWALETYMRTRGASGVAFEIIVASGPNGALPHYRPAERQIQPGEPIVIDMGARVDGYHSDLTRTIVLGEADAKFREIYAIVLQAQQTAESQIRAGMSARDADAIARSVIASAGYGDYFGHNLGHGVGLAIHEKPRLSALSDEVLQPGSVVTVEPGIYLPDWGGVRIEDMVVIGTDGVEVLTQAPKEF